MKKFIFAATISVTVGLMSYPALAHSVEEALPGAKKVSGVVPGMGEHWVHKKYPGAVFGQHNGKLNFIEYEIKSSDLKGSGVIDLGSFKMPPFVGKIDHSDIEYLAKGHPGMAFPHTTIHMYTVPHAEHMAIKPPKK